MMEDWANDDKNFCNGDATGETAFEKTKITDKDY